jgi:predicted DNA-binding transcriptional regulator YafY
LSGFDFIKNKSIDIPISDDFVVKTEKDLYVKIAPDFKLIPSHRGKEWSEKSSIDSLLKDSVSNRYFTTIKYKNREEKLTTRTVSDIKLHSTLERLETATETTLVEVLYLEAYCHLRETIRYFKVDRVISIKQLNLKYKIL